MPKESWLMSYVVTPLIGVIAIAVYFTLAIIPPVLMVYFSIKILRWLEWL